MTPYEKKDAKEDTGASNREVKEMWHQARDDARSCGELDDRPAESPSSRAENEPSSESFDDNSFFSRLTGRS